MNDEIQPKRPRYMDGWSERILPGSAEVPTDQQPPGEGGQTLCQWKGHQWTVVGKCAACGGWRFPGAYA